MNVKAFNRSVPFRVLLEYYSFENISESGNKLRACCKIHGGDSPTSFEVDTTSNVWYCHSGCKFGGDAIKLVQIMEEMDFFNAIIKLSSICNIDITTLTLEKGVVNQYDDAIKFFESIASPIPITTYIPPNTNTINVKEYRGISSQTCKDFNIRFTRTYPIMDFDGTKRGTRVTNKVIFDILFGGNLVGQSLRSISADDNIRWLHMPSGFKRSRILFNHDKAMEYINTTGDTTLIVCEGIMDVLRVYDAGYHNVVAPLGCNLTKEQIRLISCMATDVIFMFDNDVAGKIATEKYNTLLKKTFDVYNIKLPIGKKDPGECSVDEIRDIIKKRWRIL